MTTTDLKITGMTCGHCEAAIRGEVEQVAGVENVDVSAQTGRLVVTGSQPIDDAAIPAPDTQRVGEIFDELEFGSGLRGRLFEALAAEDAAPRAAAPATGAPGSRGGAQVPRTFAALQALQGSDPTTTGHPRRGPPGHRVEHMGRHPAPWIGRGAHRAASASSDPAGWSNATASMCSPAFSSPPTSSRRRCAPRS